MIHPAANIHSTARIGRGVEIGPDSVIEKNVSLGDGTIVGPRVFVGEGSRIGKSCRIFEFAKIGAAPRDFPCNSRNTLLVMGEKNTVRECVTIDRGTAEANGKTTIGRGNLFMANSHVGPGCRIGNHVVLAIGASLAGQNSVGNHAVLGGVAEVGRHHRVGSHALVTAGTHASRDVPPYMLASGNRGRLFGPNLAALANYGFSEETLKALKRSYDIIFRAGLTLRQAMKKLDAEDLARIPQVQHILQFLQNSKIKGRP